MKSAQQWFFAFLAVLMFGASFALPAEAAGKSVAGLWEVEGTPEGAPGPAFTNFARLNKDGGVTNIDPWFGTGLGDWEHSGGRYYHVSFIHLFFDGADVWSVEVSGELSLSQDSNTLEGPFSTTMKIGNFVMDTVEGTVVLTRQ